MEVKEDVATMAWSFVGLVFWMNTLSCLVNCQDDFQQEPFIRYEPQDVTVLQGDEISLTCGTMGYPPPTVKWYLNSKEVVLNKWANVLPDHSLIISSATRTDGGTYHCIARNKAGDYRSRNATVVVKYLASDFGRMPQNASVNFWVKHIFYCIPPDGFPTPQLYWYKDNVLLVSNSKYTITESQNETRLQIDVVQLDDVGAYTCVAKNNFERKSPPAYLVFNDQKPEVRINSDKVDIYVGKEIRLICAVFAKPTADVTWRKVNGDLPDSTRAKIIYDTLTVQNAVISDSGQYECTAKNSLGEDTASSVVSVYEPPRFLVQPTNQKIGLGHMARFECRVVGGKALRLAWFYKWQRYSYDDAYLNNGVRVNKDNELSVENINKNNEGSLYCQIVDEVFDEFNLPKIIKSIQVSLTVLRTEEPPPTLTLTPSPTKTVYEDTSFTLYCSGKNTDTYEWDHASTNEIIRGDTADVQIKTDASGSTLTFNNVILGDADTYRCKGIGPTGTATKTTVVNVLASGGGVPEQIPSAYAVVLSSTSVQVKWMKPSAHSLAPILSYVVTIVNVHKGTENDVVITDPTATEKILTGLDAGVVYKFLVYAKNKNGNGASRSTQQIETKDMIGTALPDSVDKLENVVLTLTMDVRTLHSITVSWAPVSPSRINNYYLYYQQGSSEFQKKYVEKFSSNYLLDGLEPGTKYQLYLQAVNDKHLSSPSPQIAVETSKLRPLPVPYVHVDYITASRVKIMWGAPVTATAPPTQFRDYVITVSNLRSSNETKLIHNQLNSRERTISNLQPSSIYRFSVQVTDIKGDISEPTWSNIVQTMRVEIPAPLKVGMQKIDNNNLEVYWKAPENFENYPEAIGFTVTCVDRLTGKVFLESQAARSGSRTTMSGLKTWTAYKIYVSARTEKGRGQPSEAQMIVLGNMRVGEVRGVTLIPTVPPEPTQNNKKSILNIVKEPWFIATVGVFLWLCLLALIIFVCCRRARRKKRRSHFESRRGLMGTGTSDYPDTSLSRRTNSCVRNPSYSGSQKKKRFCHCCTGDTDSIEEEFPNRADIKPLMTYTKHNGSEAVEMRQKGNIDGKENNIGLAMKNGIMVDTPLNNEFDYRHSDQKLYDSNEKSRYRLPPGSSPLMLSNSGSMARREQRYQTDSVERRHAEIVRTAAPKTFPDAELVNVLENNPQATWKQEGINSPRTKPPGENTLRRQGKSQFKPIPKLEVLNWNISKEPSSVDNDGSEPGSPKHSSSASVFSENTDRRADSRMSHGGSSNSLNKYQRRRRHSNASSMMSSELYQSEMDPSGYSDVMSDRKSKKREKVPPPIDLEGLTSDILLQWAESVTNSSPSSSGSSSPDRLSGISSEGSVYTDEDFAQAVAGVARCNGFNMDYDYSLPGMPGAQQPLSSSRNTKMNKIDQVLAQRSKLRNSPAGTQVGKSPATPLSNLPQISMSGYLTGSHKGPQSTHSAPSGIPRANRYKGSALPDKYPTRYGTGFQDVDSVSTASSSKPLTLSNLLHHDSSLEREKKHDGTKPLTISNLRQHETSLDRHRVRQQPVAPVDRNGYSGLTNENKVVSVELPQPPLSSMSALERHESMNSNSKDSINSSNRHDSEIENTPGTSERKNRPRKHYVNLRDPQSSTSTVSTIKTPPDNGNSTDC